jgi:drug/metabolite transporter (DMT)-like permease
MHNTLLLIGLIVLTMVALAANSILTRAGIFDYLMDPLAFAGTRLAAGAVTLAAVIVLQGLKDSQSKSGGDVNTRGEVSASTTNESSSTGTVLLDEKATTSESDTNSQSITWQSFLPAIFLLMYLIPFSLAYLTLPSGLGALVLFGVVQITMFAASAGTGKTPSLRQWIGMCVASTGLAWILWPKEDFDIDYSGVGFMILSGLGWGVFCVFGRRSKKPLVDMTDSFVRCLPVAVLLMIFGKTDGHAWSVPGTLTAIIAGSLTSGLGYALWYFLLPSIPTAVAAITQLSVPPIAMIMGAIFLDEVVTLEIVLGSLVVLLGIGLSVEYDWLVICNATKNEKSESILTSEIEAPESRSALD